MATGKSRRRAGAPPTPKPRGGDGGEPVVPDDFYKAMVWNLRNGVVAVTRDGRLAVMNEVAYRVLGLQAGADDYIVKPFSARDLLVRIGSKLAVAEVAREAHAIEAAARRETEHLLASVAAS